MAIALERIGWNVHLMGKSNGIKPFQNFKGFHGKVTIIPRKNIFSTEVNYHLILWKILLSEKIDIVLFEPPHFRLIMLPAILSWLKIIKSLFILDVRTPLVEASLKSKIERSNYWLTMKYSKWFLRGVSVITEGLKKDLQPLFGNNKPVAVWESGVDPEIFNPSAAKSNLRYDLGLERRFIFFYHGALTANRGIPELISAVVNLSAEYNEVALVLLGDGPSVKELKKQAYESGAKNKVYFLGTVNNADVPKYISIADVGVIPLPNKRCWLVSSPLKLFEYMAMELPLVVSDIEAHRSVIGDAPYAVYSREANAVGLYEALKLSIAKFSELKKNAYLAREQAIKKHTWTKRGEVLSEFLKAFKN